MTSSLKVNFHGLLNEISLPEYKSLWPLFEAIVNSIQSINDSRKDNEGLIQIKAIRYTEKTIGDITSDLYSDFEITDNGNGFNNENYESFLEAYTSLKISKGCKGLGRFLWLKAFERVEIESVYVENGCFFKRQFEFSEKDFVNPEDNAVETDENMLYTRIKLIGFKNKYQRNCSVSIEPIAKKIIEHCMMYFISDSCPRIEIQDENDKIILNDYFNNNIKDTLHRDEIVIEQYKFYLYHIQMNENANKHELHLCASDREVESYDVSKKITNLNTRLIDNDGVEYYYTGYLSGEYLDAAVNSNRTAFNIEKDHNLTNTITKNDILDKAVPFIELYLKEDLDKIIKHKMERINTFVSFEKPQYSFLLNAKPEIYDRIPNGLKDDELELELHKQSQKWEREIKEIGKKIEQDNKDKIKSIADFDDIFEKYCSGVSELNKASLSEYVIRRKTILDLLEKALEWDDDKKYKKEEIIHSLICPMRHSSKEIPYDEMNLWIVDEKLAFHNYLASDQKLKSIPVINSNSDDRVDLAIFDQALSYSSDKDSFNSISIVELKRPDRNNYSSKGKDDDPIEQVLRYVKQIREGKVKLANGRPFGNVTNTSFYCYIIADLTPTLIDKAETADFTKTPDGEGYYKFNQNRNAFIEIISYSKLLRDAKKSNQALFEKLFTPNSSEIKHLY
jgi:hypothetical protein